MSKRKWHDITSETGDPKDLPTETTWYCVTRQDYIDTWRLQWHPHARLWYDDEGNIIRDVIAWREMPRAYVPGKRKPKPARFVHECEVSDGPRRGIEVTVAGRPGPYLFLGEDIWRGELSAMWGDAAREYIEQTRVGKPIPVRITVEMLK